MRKHEFTGHRRRGKPKKTWFLVITNELRVNGLMADRKRKRWVWKKDVKNYAASYTLISGQTT